ncbi:MAG TPA: glycosyltransferase, partial [Candidatus Omnitrophota bacterium]|nr:glycosyltransferase [Candidatus Omnitrophota bacterium]
MNILLLTSHFDTGGITSYVTTLSAGLYRAGHRVIVVSAGGDAVGVLEKTGARHVRMDIRVKSEAHPKIYLGLPRLAALIRAEDIDIIHAQTRVTQVMAFWLSRMTGKPFVSTCHGFFRPRWFRKVFSCWGQGVIAISRGVREHLIKDFNVNPDSVHLVPNGIDMSCYPFTDEVLRRQKRVQWSVDGSPVIGIIARLSDVKGIDVLIRAMPSVVASFPRVWLMIVGQGPQENDLRMLVDQLGLEKSVDFRSTVQSTADILPAFDVFVMPSLQEGLGLSVMEAMAAGISVVASNVGGLPDLVKDGQTGFLTPVGDSAALGKRINAMLGDPVRALNMARAARTLMEKEFSAERMVEGTIKVYERSFVVSTRKVGTPQDDSAALKTPGVNILVVNVNWLGDAIFSTPVFKALKANFPGARVCCLCVPRVQEVLTHCPDVDEIIVYDEKGRHRTPWGLVGLIAQLRGRRFDAAFLLHRSFTRALMVYLAGIPQRVGYSKAPRLLTHPVAFPGDDIHRSDAYLKVLEAYGLRVEDRCCALTVGDAWPKGLTDNAPYLVLNTGGNWKRKQWPEANWADLARRAAGTGVQVVFSGSPKDKEPCDRIIKAAGIAAVNLAGTTTLAEALVLFKNAKAVVSCDTGPLHLANSVGAPVVALFGPTRPEITGPRGSGKAAVVFKDVGCNKAPC